MKEKSTIALVDDERNILTSLGLALEAEGYKVRTYSDGAQALEALTEEPADLAILDIKMPRMDGMELLRRLRQQSDMPVIFLTSKDEEIDQLFGLKMGADDYISKPFSQRLVVERVKAVLRRVAPKDGTTVEEESKRVLERGKLKLDPERHTCHWDNKPVTLTVTEFLILQALATRPGVVKTRDALMDAAAPLDPVEDPTSAGFGVVYWSVEKGRSIDSPFARVLARPAYRQTTTTRNLRTLAVDVHLSETIAAKLPKGLIAVSESGPTARTSPSRAVKL